MSDNDLRPALNRRADASRRLSSLTAALTAASVAGTGVVVYAVSHHPSATAASGGAAPTTATPVSSGSASVQAPPAAPAPTQAAPIVVSHGS